MTLTTLLIQILLPIALLVWLARLPSAGAVAYALHVAALAAVLLALALVAVWAFAPWWLPSAYGVGLVVIVAWQVWTGRVETSTLWSLGPAGSVALAVLVALGGYGSWLSLQALKGRAPPDVETVDVASPFGPGIYLVALGGSTEMVNGHLKTLDVSVERFEPWRGQSRGLDFIKVTTLGLRVDGWHPADPARYETFGAPLFAPCAGTVALARDGLPDMPVPQMDRDNKLGNFVAIDCGGFAVFLAHLRHDSVKVSPGRQVAVGDAIGDIGNSGNSSEPHLHIHAQRGIPPDAPAGGEPLGLTIDGRFLVRNDRLRMPAR